MWGLTEKTLSLLTSTFFFVPSIPHLSSLLPCPPHLHPTSLLSLSHVLATILPPVLTLCTSSALHPSPQKLSLLLSLPVLSFPAVLSLSFSHPTLPSLSFPFLFLSPTSFPIFSSCNSHFLPLLLALSPHSSHQVFPNIPSTLCLDPSFSHTPHHRPHHSPP